MVQSQEQSLKMAKINICCSGKGCEGLMATSKLKSCRKCEAVENRVVTLSCGHHFCLTCLENQHADWTERCKQPCQGQACLKLTVPTRAGIGGLVPKIGNAPDISRHKPGNVYVTIIVVRNLSHVNRTDEQRKLEKFKKPIES